MRVIRAGLPGLIGVVLLFLGIGAVDSGLQAGSREGLLYGVRSAFIPISVAIGLLLTALAIWRGFRAGYVLGLLVAACFALGGIGLGLLATSYLSSEEFGGLFAFPLILGAGGWTAVWVLYAWGLGKARSTFAPAWQRADRVLATVLAALLVAAMGINLSLNAIEGSAVAADEGSQLQAQALVDGTTLTVQVADATFAQVTVGGTSGPVVEHLKLLLVVNAAVKYALLNRPTLCLTDLATFHDPAYKSGNVCWGDADGTAVVVMDDVGTPGLPEGSSGIDVDLSRGNSRCPFPAGAWNAELTLAPRTDGGGATAFSIAAIFQVGTPAGETGQPSSGLAADTSACMASLVSK